MRWGIVLILLLASCTVPVEPTPTGLTSFHSEIIHEPEEFVEPVELEPIEESLPNYTDTRAGRPDLSCTHLGCDSNTQIVTDRRYWYPCSCEKALDIPFKQVKCLTSFDETIDDDIPRHPEC